MAAETVWRTWRRKVHDILEVGGDAHPAAYVVNTFIVTLIVLNAVAFAAETVDDLAKRYAEALHCSSTRARSVRDSARAVCAPVSTTRSAISRYSGSRTA